MARRWELLTEKEKIKKIEFELWRNGAYSHDDEFEAVYTPQDVLQEMEVKDQIYSVVAKKFARRFVKEGSALQLDKSWIDEGGEEVYYHDVIGNKEDIVLGQILLNEAQSELDNKLKSLLTTKQKEVWDLYMSGYSNQEIGEKLGTDSEAVKKMVGRTKQKLANEL